MAKLSVAIAEKSVRIAELERAYAQMNGEICETLGRALGYPTIGPEAGGDHTTICVGDHVAESLATESASRIADLENERAELYQFLDMLNSAGLRLNDVPIKRALEIIRKLGGSKHVWPQRLSIKESSDGA